MQYGAAHPFVFWIEAIAYVVKAQLTMLAKKNLIWYESGGQKIRPFAWILQGARPFGSGRVSFPQPVTCQPPQTCSVTGSWRRLDRLGTHGAEFFYVNLGLLKALQKKTVDKFWVICESHEMWQLDYKCDCWFLQKLFQTVLQFKSVNHYVNDKPWRLRLKK